MFAMEETPSNQVVKKTSDPEGGLNFFCLFLEQCLALQCTVQKIKSTIDFH